MSSFNFEFSSSSIRPQMSKTWLPISPAVSSPSQPQSSTPVALSSSIKDDQPIEAQISMIENEIASSCKWIQEKNRLLDDIEKGFHEINKEMEILFGQIQNDLNQAN